MVGNGTLLPAVRVGSWTMVVLPVEIDICGADRIAGELAATLADGVSVVVADMSGTEFCDSAGMRALLSFHQRALARGTELRLVVTTPTVLRVFEVMGMDRVLPVYTTLDAAMAGAPGRAAALDLAVKAPGREAG